MKNQIRVSDNQMCDSLARTSLTLQNAVLRCYRAGRYATIFDAWQRLASNYGIQAVIAPAPEVCGYIPAVKTGGRIHTILDQGRAPAHSPDKAAAWIIDATAHILEGKINQIKNTVDKYCRSLRGRSVVIIS